MNSTMNISPAGLAAARDSATALAAKCEALEKLVIELTLIAISTAHIKHHHKSRLDQLLSELQYAGIESPNGADEGHGAIGTEPYKMQTPMTKLPDGSGCFKIANEVEDKTETLRAATEQLQKALEKLWSGVVEMHKDARTDYKLPSLAKLDLQSMTDQQEGVIAALRAAGAALNRTGG